MAWRATRKEERPLESKGKYGPSGRPALRGEVEKREPTRQAGRSRQRSRKRTKTSVHLMKVIDKGAGEGSIVSKALNIHIQKEMKLPIGFNNKDVVYDLSESSFQAAKHINQLPWV